MSSNPKLIVLNLKELIYTILFIILTVILIFCMRKLFFKESSSSKLQDNSVIVESSSELDRKINPIFSYIEFQNHPNLH